MRAFVALRSLFTTLAMLALSGAACAQIGVGISVSFGPPELPVYEQPICPGDGYIWTPGYWAWDADGDDYYWVPGTWVVAPEVGYLWTPGWWGWGGGAFFFHEGYWGPRVGYYGGINYGYGYLGHGYEGGRWDNGHFFYNRSVNNVNVTEIHNVYNTTVVNNYNTPRVSYNGGKGGINERATAQELAAANERHIPPVAVQTQHVQAARSEQQLRASVNHGKPPIAATSKSAAFNDRGVVPARAGGNYNPPPRSANTAVRPSNTAVHPNELPAHTRPPAPNTGDQNLDQKYQKQQEKLYAQQEKEHQKLQQKQDQEHQKLAQQNAPNKPQMQQVEQKHQQQTQQLEQKHAQQQQQMQSRQQPHQAPPQQSSPKPPK